MRTAATFLCLRSLTAALLLVTAGPAASAWADVSQIVILTNRNYTNGVSNSSPYRQQIEVMGSGITGVDVLKPGAAMPISLSGDYGTWRVKSGTYSTLDALRADYPTGDYQFTFHYASPTPDDTVSLLFDAVEPTDGVQVVTPTYPANGATNVPYSSVPTITWDSVAASGWTALGCELHRFQGDYVDGAHPYDLGNTSWTPQVSSLAAGEQYRLMLSIYQKGSSEFGRQTTGGDGFDYYGVIGHVNETEFTTVPEPGTLALLAVGGVVLLWRRRSRIAVR